MLRKYTDNGYSQWEDREVLPIGFNNRSVPAGREESGCDPFSLQKPDYEKNSRSFHTGAIKPRTGTNPTKKKFNTIRQ